MRDGNVNNELVGLVSQTANVERCKLQKTLRHKRPESDSGPIVVQEPPREFGSMHRGFEQGAMRNIWREQNWTRHVPEINRMRS